MTLDFFQKLLKKYPGTGKTKMQYPEIVDLDCKWSHRLSCSWIANFWARCNSVFPSLRRGDSMASLCIGFQLVGLSMEAWACMVTALSPREKQMDLKVYFCQAFVSVEIKCSLTSQENSTHGIQLTSKSANVSATDELEYTRVPTLKTLNSADNCFHNGIIFT